ncbi:MAG: hypothetical protein EBT94_03735 [Alphaproteobacteria bacterium]|nr:hypothetical protein [Alphaproteobacteria bacterium]
MRLRGQTDQNDGMRRGAGLTALEQQHQRRRYSAIDIDDNAASHRGKRQVADRMAFRCNLLQT